MSSYTVKAWAAPSPGATLESFEYSLPEIGPEEVDVQVESCGMCHSDLSMLNNEWDNTDYPFVPGHEAIGRVIRTGESVTSLQAGDLVGVGWVAFSCQHCDPCLSGQQHLCGSGQPTIVGRHGGFADTLRCHWLWATPLPSTLDAASAGPLFCGGITVFSPILLAGVRPTDRVGVIGIGGLGHLALQFLHHWGCEVTAFTTSDDKTEEAQRMGAHQVINSRNKDALKPLRGHFDFILSTVNVSMDWNSWLGLLRENGRLHVVGAVLEPMAIPAFSLLGGQKSVAGSPVGSPADIRSMLEFCARHQIRPVTETFAMDQVNDAFEHLHSGRARYRIVLQR